MPIYEYECKKCGHHLEAIQKFSDAPLTNCEACGRPELQKLLSATGFVLKGSGWYASDYKPAKKEPEACQATADGGCAKEGCAANSASEAASV